MPTYGTYITIGETTYLRNIISKETAHENKSVSIWAENSSMKGDIDRLWGAVWRHYVNYRKSFIFFLTIRLVMEISESSVVICYICAFFVRKFFRNRLASPLLFHYCTGSYGNSYLFKSLQPFCNSTWLL